MAVVFFVKQCLSSVNHEQFSMQMLQLQAQQVVWGVNPRRGRFSIETPLENADKKFIGERIEEDIREAVRTSRSTGTFLMQWEEIFRHFLSVFF